MAPRSVFNNKQRATQIQITVSSIFIRMDYLFLCKEVRGENRLKFQRIRNQINPVMVSPISSPCAIQTYG